MVDKIDLLKKLPSFNNIKKVVKVDQGVGDIIKGILRTHEEYKLDYDKISEYFLGNGLKDTANNIWNFLKKNVAYYIESDNMQTLRSPAAIISLPADCKSYALFSNGVLDSLRRKGKINCKLAFRFAGYDSLSDHLEHVFCVINPDNANELWCDPVLNSFNLKKHPSVYRDKKIENMSLIALSGISGNYDNKQPAKFGNVITDLTSVAAGAGSLTNPVSAVTSAIATLSSLFGGKKDTLQEYLKWDNNDSSSGHSRGSSARQWIINDGDDTNFESKLILSYIYDFGINQLLNSGVTTTNTQYSNGSVRNVTFDEILNKIKRGGIQQNIIDDFTNRYKPSIFSNLLSSGTSGSSTTKAGMNIYVTLALVGAGIYAVSKMSK